MNVNVVNLEISKKLIGVTGRDNGRKIAKEQILPVLKNITLPINIVFPKHIVLVGSSFIEGIEDVLGTELTVDQITKKVGYVSSDKSINKDIIG